MERDSFSHIRLWCPRPFGTYSQNKPRSAGSSSGTGPATAPPICSRLPDSAVGDVRLLPEVSSSLVDVENTPPEPDASSASGPQSQASAPSAPPPSGASPSAPSPSGASSATASSSGAPVEDGRVLLDTWYVIKPGNTKEKIAFFVAHQISGAGLTRPSAMKVKGNWATDCSKAKRRRRCSSYDPPPRSTPPPRSALPAPSAERSQEDSSTDTGPVLTETDLLSVAQMVALVEQRTALALQGIVGLHSSLDQSHPSDHQLLRGTVSDPTPVVFVPNRESKDPPDSPIQTDQDLEEQQESCRVAEAIAHFESQNLEKQLNLGHGINSEKDKDESARGASSGIVTPPPPQATHSHGEVRIAFRVSNIDSRSQLEPVGRSRCMFMTCGGASGQSSTRSKEKITCDLYQLVSPSSRDPSSLLLAATTTAPKQDGDTNVDTNSTNCSDSKQENGSAEKKSRERVTGFHVEVVVTGAVDQCVFYGKDSTENVQEETVCFAMQSSSAPAGGEQSDDPPPGQLFFLQRGPDDEIKSANACSSSSSSMGKACEHVNNNNNSSSNLENARPESPIVTEECSDSSLCRLYRHVSHDFLEIRFQIQRLLEPRQYMILLPDHIMVNILSYLPTRSLAALKCTCHYFKALIDTYGVRAVDSRWNQDPLYRDDPCKQCKRQYERGDVSLCRWHPKPYHHDLPYGRSYWMCCRRTDKDTPGCRVGLHDNNWVQHAGEGGSIRARREERREEPR